MARKLLVTLLQGFLNVILALSLYNGVYGQPGLGISHYDINETIPQGVSKTFGVGRIYNTGNITLSISAFWVQSYGNSALPVTVDPKSKVLQPEQSYVVYIIIHEDTQVGYYNGSVEIEATPFESVEGNPIVPGGSLEVQITVEGSTPSQPDETVENETETVEPVTTEPGTIDKTSYILIGVAVICVATAIVCIKKWRQRCE